MLKAASQPALDTLTDILGSRLHPVALAAEPAGMLETRLSSPDMRARLDAGQLITLMARARGITSEEALAQLTRARFVLKRDGAEALAADPEAVLNLVNLLTLARSTAPEARFLTIMAPRENFLAAVEKAYTARNRLAGRDRRQVQSVIDTLRNRVHFIAPDNAALEAYAGEELAAGRGVAVLGDDRQIVEGAINFRLDQNRIPKHAFPLLLPAIVCGGSLAAAEMKGKTSVPEQQLMLPSLLGKIFEGADIAFLSRAWYFRSVEGFLARLVEARAAAIIDQSA
jgi:hypothetical protein